MLSDRIKEANFIFFRLYCSIVKSTSIFESPNSRRKLQMNFMILHFLLSVVIINIF